MDKHSNALNELEAKLSDAAIYEQDKSRIDGMFEKQTEQSGS